MEFRVSLRTAECPESAQAGRAGARPFPSSAVRSPIVTKPR